MEAVVSFSFYFDILVFFSDFFVTMIYSQKAKKIAAQSKFDYSGTEQYEQLKNLKETNDNYKTKALELQKHPTNMEEDEIMRVSRTLRPFLSQAHYTSSAKKLAEKYHICMDDQDMARALKVGEAISNRLYKKGYQKSIVGVAPQDPSLPSYQSEFHANQLSKIQSEKLYRKEGDVIKTTGKLPLDYLGFKHAEQSALIASDALYTKSRKEVISKMKGWQTMDYQHHPIIRRQKYLHALQSDTKYQEESKAAHAESMFMVQLTEGYEAQNALNTTLANYRKDADKIKQKNKYQYTATEMYDTTKKLKEVGDNKYVQKAKKLAENPLAQKETPEMIIAKSLSPFASHSKYTTAAKKLQEKYNITMDETVMANSLKVSDMISKQLYLKGYNDQIKGKAPADPSLHSYPTEDQAVKNSKNQSIALYRKEGDLIKTSGKLPLDYMEFIRSKKAAIIASDALYRVSREEAIKKHKYWQTMDVHQHPIVQHAHEALLRNSDAYYKEDALAFMTEVSYPYWLTEGYELSQKLKHELSNTEYYKEAKLIEANHKFNFAQSEGYQNSILAKNMVDHKYSAKAKAEAANPIAQATNFQMEVNKTLDICKQVAYTQAAKKLQEKYHITMDETVMANCLRVSQDASDLLYKKGYRDQMVGKAPHDISLDTYQTEANAVKNSKIQSIALYKKEAAKQQTTGKLPLDCVEFERIKKNAINASDALYRASREEAIKEQKAWQTMDYSQHPIVRRSAYLNTLASEAKYRKEAKQEHEAVNFPVQVTEQFENQQALKSIISDAAYTKEANEIKQKSKFDFGQTESFERSKNLRPIVSDKQYSAKARELERKPIAMETNEQIEIAKSLQPFSDAHYKNEAKRLMGKFSITMDETTIANALKVSDITSTRLYQKGYKDQMVGKAPNDLSLPTYQTEHQAVKNSKNQSIALYKKEAALQQTTGKLPLDCVDFERIKKNAMNASDALYRASREEAIRTQKAWQTMDYAQHPIVRRSAYLNTLASEAKYRREAKQEHEGVNYPVQITEQFENTKALKNIISDAAYSKAAKEIEHKSKFAFTETERYQNIKELQAVNDTKYSVDAKELQKKPLPMEMDETMKTSQNLRPFLSDNHYKSEAKYLATKFHLTIDEQVIANQLKVTDIISMQNYKKGYNEQMLGRAPQDQSLPNYPSEFNAVTVSKLTSEALYREEGNKLKMTGKLPLDCIDFNRNKNAAIIASDALYRKSRIDAIKTFNAWQTMDYWLHPIVERSHQLKLMYSDSYYKEEALAEMGGYFPVQITEGYELARKVTLETSKKEYEREARLIEAKHKFDFSKSDEYDRAKKQKELSSIKYERAAKEVNQKPLPMEMSETMKISQQLTPFWSNTRYVAEAKILATKYNLTMDDQRIALALKTTQDISEKLYKQGFRDQIVGKAPQDLNLHSFQAEANAVRVSKETSDALYRKDGKVFQETGKLPLGCIDFERSKKAAKIASDALYKKTYREVLKKYKGWQRMDHFDHPLVTESIRVQNIINDAEYRIDAKEEQDKIYFPVYITEGYELARKLTLETSKHEYEKEARAIEASHKYDYSQTDFYKTGNEIKKVLNGDYTKNAKELNAKPLPIEESEIMAISKALMPIWSQNRYMATAKKLAEKYHFDQDDLRMALALKCSDVVNEKLYKEGYRNQILGKGPVDPSLHTYMVESRLNKMKNDLSNANYRKEGDAFKTTGKLPLDCIDFNRARNQKNILSTAMYSASRREMLRDYRGFQNMDVYSHPVVSQALRINEIQSDVLYKMDAKEMLEGVYFPCHITESYELALKVQKQISRKKYRTDGKKVLRQNKFDFTKTDKYTNSVANQLILNDKTYGAAAKENLKKPTNLTTDSVMERAATIQPLLCEKKYTDAAIKLLSKYALTMDVQSIAQALQVSTITSDKLYREGYNKNIKGTLTNDPQAFPEYILAKNVSHAVSNAEYTKTGREIKNKFNLPLGYIELVRAKKNQINVDHAAYSKTRREVMKNMMGFQRMSDHPVIEQARKANERTSNFQYQAEWNEDKDFIFFPFHISPAYETAKELKNVISDANYKVKPGEREAGEKTNHFNVTETEAYQNAVKVQQAVSNAGYTTAATEANKKPAPQEQLYEVEMAKKMNHIWSQFHYQKEAKALESKYHLTMDEVEMTRALKMSHDINENAYRAHYKEKMVGATPVNPAIAYPEIFHHAIVNKNVSTWEYMKDAEIGKHQYTLKEDFPAFLHSKAMSVLLSEHEYRKQRDQAVKDFKGFMRMDANVHPVVVRGQKVHKIMSDYWYRKEYEEDKDMIFMPTTITPAYEQIKNVSKFQSDINYKQPIKAKNEYLYTDMDQYKTNKNVGHLLNPLHYRQEAADNLAKGFTQMPELPITAKAKELEEFMSDTLYRRHAKRLFAEYNIDAHDYHLKHTLSLKGLASEHDYKKEYETDMKGKYPADLANSYPEYIHLQNVAKQNSEALYKMDAEKNKHHFTIKDDYPMFKNAVQVAKNISDIEYHKSKWSAIKDMKGWFHMDASTHPIVKNGIRSAKQVSHNSYIADYMMDRDYIFFPVHITDNYDTCVKNTKMQSDNIYKQKPEFQNKFQFTQTDAYKQSVELQEKVFDVLYRKKGKELVTGKSWASHITPLRQAQKELRELMSEANYRKTAKDIMGKYSIDMSYPEIKNAMQVNELVSKTRYTQLHENSLGKMLAVAIEDFPEYIHARNVTNQTSQALYVKDNEKTMHNYTLIADQHLFQISKEQQKLLNSTYGSGKREAIDTMKGFMRMDASVHPVVTEGVKKHKLMSDYTYRKEYHEDKDMIFYPFTISETYDVAQKNNQNVSKKAYTKKADEEKAKIKFQAQETEQYKLVTEAQKLIGSVRYQKDKEEMKGTATESNQHEMYLFKEISPLLCSRRYTRAAMELLDKYNLEAKAPIIVNALQAQSLTSEALYRKHYKESVLGQACDIKDSDVLKHYCSVSKLVSDELYKKTGLDKRHDYLGKNDITPDMEHSIEVMKLISNIDYRKGLENTLKNYSSYTKINAEDDKNLQFYKKVQDNVSGFKYRQEYEEEKEFVFFPCHITEGYENAMKVSKYVSHHVYTSGYKDSRNKSNFFKLIDTPSYEFSKMLSESLSEVAYKKKYMMSRGKGYKSIHDDPLSLQAQQVSRLVSNNLYTKVARDRLSSYNLSVTDPYLLHAKAVQNLTSTANYKKWLQHPDAHKSCMTSDEWVIRFTLDQAKILSMWRYTHDAKREMHKITPLPGDTVEYKFLNALQEYLSPKKYTAGRYEALKSATGFTRLAITELKDMQNAMKAQVQNSNNVYKQEYMDDLGYNMYPFTITQYYDTCKQQGIEQSKQAYQKKYNEEKTYHTYKHHETGLYAVQKRLYEENERMYRAHYNACKGKQHDEFMNEPLFQTMLKNKKKISAYHYTEEAKALLYKYHLDPQEPRLKHAMSVADIASDAKYKQSPVSNGIPNWDETLWYKKNKDTLGLIDSVNYTKAAKLAHSKICMPTDFPSLNMAREAMKNISYKGYRDGKIEAQKNCMGFTKLPIKDLKLINIHMAAQVNVSSKVYQDDWYGWLKGNKLSMYDTPDLIHFKKTQRYLSDKSYRAKYEKEIQNRGLTTTETPMLKHMLYMSSLQSNNKYDVAARENLKSWESHMYTEMPSNKLAQAQDQYRESKYRAEYKQTRLGLKTDVLPKFDEKAIEAQKLADQKEYKAEKELMKGKTTGYEMQMEIDHHKEHALKVSDKRYAEDYHKNKDKIGDMKDAYMMTANQKVQKDVSDFIYKHMSPTEKAKYTGYFRNFLDTPMVKWQLKSKALYSQYEYQKEWNEDKYFCIYPVWLTQGYIKHHELKDQISNYAYTKKARETMDNPKYGFSLAEAMAKNNHDLASKWHYQQQHLKEKGKNDCIEAVKRHAEEHKQLMALVQTAAEQNEFRKIIQHYSLEVDTPYSRHHAQAKELNSDRLYKNADNSKPEGQDLTKWDRHFIATKEITSDLKYKQDLFLQKGHVTHISDEPWVKHNKELQKHISNHGYDDGLSHKPTKFLPEKFIKHVAAVMDNISDANYKQDYIDQLKGNVYPTFDRPDFKHYSRVGKLASEREYSKKAKKDNMHYTTVHDTPHNRHNQKAAKNASDRLYQAEYKRTQHKNLVSEAGTDTFAHKHLAEQKDNISNAIYTKHAKQDLQHPNLPESGDLVTLHQLEMTKIADKKGYSQQAKQELQKTCDMKDDKLIKHTKKMTTIADKTGKAYTSQAKAELQHNKAGITPFIQKQIDSQKMAGVDQAYTAEYEKSKQEYKASYDLCKKQVENYTKSTQNQSNIGYKQDYEDELVGACQGVPLVEMIRTQSKFQNLVSDVKYKQQNDITPKVGIDSKQFDNSKIAKKLGANYFTADLKRHQYNPEIDYDIQKNVSEHLYKAQNKEEIQKYTPVLDTPEIVRLRAQKNLKDYNYRSRPSDQIKSVKTLEMEQALRAQQSTSDAKYKDADDGRPAFSKMDSEMFEHQLAVSKNVSDAAYKSIDHSGMKGEGFLQKQQVLAQKMISDSNYRQKNDKYKVCTDSLMDKHLKKLKQIQSDSAYKNGVGHNYTSIKERQDLEYLKQASNLASNINYKKSAQQDMSFSFSTDTPAFDHYNRANILSSDVAYKRKAGQRGSGWLPDESPSYQHYQEAQAMMHSKDYKRKAQADMHTGGAAQVATIEEYPQIKQARHATDLLSDQKYKQRSNAMFNPLDTPGMEHIKFAEQIKSGTEYKRSYNENLGRGAYMLETPDMINAKNAKNLISDAEYKRKYEREMKGRAAMAMMTPEMERIRQAQSHVSDHHYKREAMNEFAAPQACLDTPEMNRIRQTKNLNSDIAYKQKSKFAPHSCLDTPQYRTVKNNTKNFSDVGYKNDGALKQGNRPNIDMYDLRTQRAMQLSKIQSDTKYRGIQDTKQKQDSVRMNAINAQKPQQVHARKRQETNATGQDYIRATARTRRYRADPGSIYDYFDIYKYFC